MEQRQVPNTSSLGRLIDDVAACAAESSDEHQITQTVADRLVRALREGLDIDPAYTRPGPGGYVMYPLWVAPDRSFSIAAAVWDVGQRTPIHDHRTWGVVGIYSGVEHEERFEPPTETESGRPQLTLERDLHPGDVTICCTSDNDVHRVSCGSSVPCVGIHVYGDDIGRVRRRAYDCETGAVSWFITDWAAVDAAA